MPVRQQSIAAETVPTAAPTAGNLATAWLPDELRAVARRFQLKKGQLVFKRGDRADAVYLLLTGQISLIRYGPGGEVVVHHRARAGEFFAEASMTIEVYHCDAVCVAPCEVLHLPSKVFASCVRNHGEFAVEWSNYLARNLRSSRTILERLRLKSPGERVLHFLVTQGGKKGLVTLNQPILAWATELGLAHETLYRTLRELVHEGLIERKGKTIALISDKTTHR
jgi:CRP-like cAMP-binding protein